MINALRALGRKIWEKGKRFVRAHTRSMSVTEQQHDVFRRILPIKTVTELIIKNKPSLAREGDTFVMKE